jgi:exodeoxyribonuclease-3
MRIATWNINSIRLRIDAVRQFTEQFAPDVLCLQETKCPDDRFPNKAVNDMGYEHSGFFGQKGYHGVAVLSKLPLTDIARRDFCKMGDCRHMAATVTAPGGQNVRIHNFYVPAGGDVADPQVNDKFAHKLNFVSEMTEWFSSSAGNLAAETGAILVGDLNIAPLPDDVWSHKQLLNVVSHTPVETEALAKAQDAYAWVDLMRRQVPEPEKLFSWWSYRAKDWEASNRGRRLDHIWATPGLDAHCAHAEILKSVRGWERPSDHAPIIADFKF